MDAVRGSKMGPNTSLRKSRPNDEDRACKCGRKISRYNPNSTCWEHTPIRYGQIRGVKAEDR